MGTGDQCRVPQAAVCHGRARQNSGTGPCGDYRRVLLLPYSRGHYSEKFAYRETWVQDDEGRRVPTLKSKLIRDLV